MEVSVYRESVLLCYATVERVARAGCTGNTEELDRHDKARRENEPLLSRRVLRTALQAPAGPGLVRPADVDWNEKLAFLPPQVLLPARSSNLGFSKMVIRT